MVCFGVSDRSVCGGGSGMLVAVGVVVVAALGWVPTKVVGDTLLDSVAGSAGSGDETVLQDAVSLLEECGTQNIILCMKERTLNYIDQLPSNLDFGGGLSIKRTDGLDDSASRFARKRVFLPDDPKAREASVNGAILDRILNYLGSHTFEFRMPDAQIAQFRRSLQDTQDEARKKKKKGISLMTLFHLKMAMVGALALKAIGLIAFKAFVMAKIALAIASIIALKKLLEHKHTSTYEVLAHPYEEHGHYDRSFEEIRGVGGAAAVDLPYKGYQRKILSNI